MNIFYVDGFETFEKPYETYNTELHVVSSSKGYEYNMNLIESLPKDANILTDCVYLLDFDIGWDENINSPSVHLWTDRGFKNVSKLTNRELKRGHNLMKLYMAGEFEERIKGE